MSFKDKVKKIIEMSKKEGEDSISYEEISLLIEYYQEELNGVLIENISNCNNETLEEIDFILILFCDIYNSWRDFLFTKKFQDEKFGISTTLIFRDIIGDFIASRNLYILGLENQHNSITRNLIEKFRFLFLVSNDSEFKEKVLFDKTITQKDLYNNYTKPSKITKRLKKLLVTSENDILKAGVEVLTSKRTDEYYSLLSKFTHSNELSFFLKYYLEENIKYNVGFSDCKSIYLNSRISYFIEFFIYLLAPTMSILNSISEIKESKKKIYFLISYSIVQIEEKYN